MMRLAWSGGSGIMFTSTKTAARRCVNIAGQAHERRLMDNPHRSINQREIKSGPLLAQLPVRAFGVL